MLPMLDSTIYMNFVHSSLKLYDVSSCYSVPNTEDMAMNSTKDNTI